MRSSSLYRQLLTLVCAFSFASDAMADRIKDLASLAAVRTNQLVGYGIVVGLQGTGDGTDVFTVQTIRAMFNKMGVGMSMSVPWVKRVAYVVVL